MTEPMKDPGSSEVSDNAFSGPTGAQSGNSNTQVNHYAAPPTSPGGAGQWVRGAIVTIAVLVVAGGMGLVAIEFVPGGGDGRTQAGQTSDPTVSPSHRESLLPLSPPSTPPTTASPSTSPPVDTPGFDPKRGSLTPAGETLCVDVKGNRNEDDTPVQMWRCNSTDGQDWRWQGDTLRAFPKPFSRCLDVYKERRESGTPVILYHCTGRGGQRWERTRTGKLRNPLSMRCLGYPAEAPGKGMRMAIYDCDSEAARVWNYHQ